MLKRISSFCEKLLLLNSELKIVPVSRHNNAKGAWSAWTQGHNRRQENAKIYMILKVKKTSEEKAAERTATIVKTKEKFYVSEKEVRTSRAAEIRVCKHRSKDIPFFTLRASEVGEANLKI